MNSDDLSYDKRIYNFYKARFSRDQSNPKFRAVSDCNRYHSTSEKKWCACVCASCKIPGNSPCLPEYLRECGCFGK